MTDRGPYLLITPKINARVRVHIAVTCSEIKNQTWPAHLSQSIITMTVHFSSCGGSPHYIRGSRLTDKQW